MKTKGLIGLFLTCIMLISGMNFVLAADKNLYADFNGITNTIKIIVNGNNISFDQAPYNEGGTTMVPMRAIFESLGATVSYDANKKTITAIRNGIILEIVSDSSIIKINGCLRDGITVIQLIRMALLWCLFDLYLMFLVLRLIGMEIQRQLQL